MSKHLPGNVASVSPGAWRGAAQETACETRSDHCRLSRKKRFMHHRLNFSVCALDRRSPLREKNRDARKSLGEAAGGLSIADELQNCIHPFVRQCWRLT